MTQAMSKMAWSPNLCNSVVAFHLGISRAQGRTSAVRDLRVLTMPLIGNQIRRKAVDRERGLVGGEGGIRTKAENERNNEGISLKSFEIQRYPDHFVITRAIPKSPLKPLRNP